MKRRSGMVDQARGLVRSCVIASTAPDPSPRPRRQGREPRGTTGAFGRLALGLALGEGRTDDGIMSFD
jgi:hypothetical protein